MAAVLAVAVDAGSSGGATGLTDTASRAEMDKPSSFMKLLVDGDDQESAVSSSSPSPQPPDEARSSYGSSGDSSPGKKTTGERSSGSNSDGSDARQPGRSGERREARDAAPPKRLPRATAAPSSSRGRRRLKESDDGKVSHRPPVARATDSGSRNRDTSPNPAVAATLAEDRSGTNSKKRGPVAAAGATATAWRHVLTHDEMLVTKLNELHEIMSLDVDGLDRFIRRGGLEMDRHPPPPLPPPQRASRVRLRRKRTGRSDPVAEKPSSSGQPSEVPATANLTGGAKSERSRSLSSQRRVQFVVPAHVESGKNDAGNDREPASMTPSASDPAENVDCSRLPQVTGGEHQTATEEESINSGRSSGGSAPSSPSERLSSRLNHNPTVEVKASEERGSFGGDDSTGPEAAAALSERRQRPRRRTERSSERTQTSETDLRQAASADVRRWLRRKEAVIRKTKRQQREEERQKERAAAAESEIKDERRRMASEAMRDWIRKKRREQAKGKARRPAAAASAPPRSVENGDAATVGAPSAAAEVPIATGDQPQADVPKGTACASKSASAAAGAAMAASQSDGGPAARKAHRVKAEQARLGSAGTDHPASGVNNATKVTGESGTAPAATATSARPRSTTATRPQHRSGDSADTTSTVSAEARSERRPQPKIPSEAATTARGRQTAGQRQMGGGESGSRAASATSGNNDSKQRSRSNSAAGTRKESLLQTAKPPFRAATSSPPRTVGATAAEVGSQRPDAAGEAASQGIRAPPKAASARKSYDEWLRSKVLAGRSDMSTTAESSTDATPRASASEGLPPHVIRDAARRRLENLARGRTPPPRSPSRSAAADAASSTSAKSSDATTAAQTPTANASPTQSHSVSQPAAERPRRPFKWKPATGVLLDQQQRQQQSAAGQTATKAASASPPRQRRATTASAAGAGGAERVRRAGGGIDVNSETPDENPFRVPFPTLRRPRSSLERASFRGPEFAAYVHKLVSDEFRPEPQGSETPEPAVDEPAIKRGTAEAKRDAQGVKTDIPASTACAPRRCVSPEGAATAIVRTTKDRVPELSLLDSDEIFALTSLQIS